MDLREKFQIQNQEERKELRIRWTENGQQKEKTFGYKKCGKTTAMLKAEIFRNELLVKFY